MSDELDIPNLKRLRDRALAIDGTAADEVDVAISAYKIALITAGPELMSRAERASKLEEELRHAQEESEGDYRLIARLGKLLEGVADGLKGPPPELTLHDWSGLPALAKQAAARIADLTDALRQAAHDLEGLAGVEVERRASPTMTLELARAKERIDAALGTETR